MKKILFLLLLYATTIQAQTYQNPTFGTVTTKTTPTVTTPAFIGTLEATGVNGKIPSTYIEKTENKATDFTTVNNTLYPTVQAVKNYVDANSSDPISNTLYHQTIATGTGTVTSVGTNWTGTTTSLTENMEGGYIEVSGVGIAIISSIDVVAQTFTTLQALNTDVTNSPFEIHYKAYDAGADGTIRQFRSSDGEQVAYIEASGNARYNGLRIDSNGNVISEGFLFQHGDIQLRSNGEVISRLSTLTPYTVATLPTPDSNKPAFAMVNDALNPVIGQTVLGGGSSTVPVYFDGVNWKSSSIYYTPANDSYALHKTLDETKNGNLSVVGNFNVSTGSAFTNIISSLASGNVYFLNDQAGFNVPTLVGKSSNSIGLSLMSSTPDDNMTDDMRFSVRSLSGTDFTDNTKSAFNFVRGGANSLLKILRDGDSFFLKNVTIGGKLTWGSGTYVSGDSQIYNTAIAGTQLVGKTGSLSDFQLINGLGQGVYSVPTGTRNVVFDNNIYAGRFVGNATLTDTPTAPTATAGSTGTQIANLDFVNTAITNNGIITTATNITNSTPTDTSLSQNGKTLLISNGATNINYTINGNITASFVKGGSGSITFVQGSGRTMVAANGTLVFNGAQYSTASVVSFGTTDIVYINNF